MLTHHVLKQLFGHKVVLSSCLLLRSDWTSSVCRNRATERSAHWSDLWRCLPNFRDQKMDTCVCTGVPTGHGSLEGGGVQFDDCLPHFIHTDS